MEIWHINSKENKWKTVCSQYYACKNVRYIYIYMCVCVCVCVCVNFYCAMWQISNNNYWSIKYWFEQAQNSNFELGTVPMC